MAGLPMYRDFPFNQSLEFVATAIPLSYFPLAVTKTEYFKWLYRVRSWRMEFNFHNIRTDSLGNTYDMHFNGTADFDENPDYAGVLPDESWMACIVGISQIVTITNGATYTETISGVPTVTNFDVDVQFGIGGPATADPPYTGITGTPRHLILTDAAQSTEEETWDNDFLPSINFSMSVPGWGGPTPYQVLTGDKGGVAYDDLNADFDGIYVIPYWATGEGVTGFGTTVAMSGTLSIDPLTWWEMDPGDGGGPVWNSVSGVSIRDVDTLP